MTAISSYSPRVTGQTSFLDLMKYVIRGGSSAKVAVVLVICKFWRKIPGSIRFAEWLRRFIQTHLPLIYQKSITETKKTGTESSGASRNKLQSSNPPTEQVDIARQTNDTATMANADPSKHNPSQSSDKAKAPSPSSHGNGPFYDEQWGEYYYDDRGEPYYVTQTGNVKFFYEDTTHNDEGDLEIQEQVLPSRCSPKTSPSTHVDATCVRSNLRQIHGVLNFWFGKGPNQCQKSLWMITNEKQDYRQTVDLVITRRFGKTLEQLASDDDAVDWHHDSTIYGMQGKVAAIVVLDQLSRHIHRCLRERYEQLASEALRIPPQEVLDAKALKIAQQLVKEYESEQQVGMLPMPMVIFALMPYRHSQQLDQLLFVQSQVEQMATILLEKDSMLKRFRKATNRRLAVLQDEARRHGDTSRGGGFADEDILEMVPFDTDLTNAPNHSVYRTIVEFLQSEGIQIDAERSIIVSLSGGVDSMVIAAVLGHLRKSGWKLQVKAVHIDYANRPESGQEADFVRRFCVSTGIDFVCRRIDEVTRGITARDEYEKYTREIRYCLYRETVAECQSVEPVGVLLGHHRGDLRENVLSNAHKGCGPLELSGMTLVGRNDGVVLYRPLLPLEKGLVFDYAHTYGVPYFKDTTPHWSTRGMLRNKLLPLLEEIYGEGCLNNLSSLAVESDLCRKLVYDVAFLPFMEHVKHYPMGISFETEPWKEQDVFFWKFILREVLHSVGIGMFSDKSVGTFLRRVNFPRRQDGWLQCRKDVGVYLCAEGCVYVFYAKSFPWAKNSPFKYEIADDLRLRLGHENAMEFGPWKISAHLHHDDNWGSDQVKELVERKAMSSIADLMHGNLEYYLPVLADAVASDSVKPLVFTKFTKFSRPKAWKLADLKTQETLPLVHLDEETLFDLRESSNAMSTTHVICVVLKLSNYDIRL